MEHLALEVFDLDGNNSEFANLPENASITINDNSDIFGSGDIWSYSFTLNIRANAHIFGTSGELHGDRLHEIIHRRRARLWVLGTPLYAGYITLADEVDVSDNGDIRISFESGRNTFSDMIEGAKANQVPLMSDVPFGVALYRKRWTQLIGRYEMTGTVHLVTEVEPPFSAYSNSKKENISTAAYTVPETVDGDIQPVPEYPRMVFPRGTFYDRSAAADRTLNFLNTIYPYDPTHPFCNISLCYQKSEFEKPVSDDDEDAEKRRDYTLMPADRVNSAPNFFVIYWLMCLMKHLDIRVEENQMMDVEDLRRLFFVNTNCDYIVPESDKYPGGKIDKRTKCPYKLSGVRVPEQSWDLSDFDAGEARVNIKLKGTINPPIQREYWHLWDSSTREIYWDYIDNVSLTLKEIIWSGRNKYTENNKYAHLAYATSNCFPDAEISAVINSLESAFGVRFLFNNDYSSVRIVLLRNIFNNDGVQPLRCNILEMGNKQETSVRGFRMTYGVNDDTHFYYKGFDDVMTHRSELWPDDSDDHDYSQWDLDATYEEVLKSKSAFNKMCYVTPTTGNAYGVKNDEQAKRLSEYHPEVFEVAGFADAEDGDCSGEDDTIHTVSVGFVPAIMNDISKTHANGEQRFALFVDEEMEPRRYNYKDPKNPDYFSDPTKDYDVGKLFEKLRASGANVKPGKFDVVSDVPMTKLSDITITQGIRLKDSFCDRFYYHGDINTPWPDWDRTRVFGGTFDISGYTLEGYRLYLQDCFEPNDDGISPIEKHEWGLTLGVLRGTGSGSSLNVTDDPDDGEGNATWAVVPGKDVSAHPDTCDNYGNLWDYNGSQTIASRAAAINVLNNIYHYSNFDLVGRLNNDYLVQYFLMYVPDADGKERHVMLARRTIGNRVYYESERLYLYVNSRLRGKSTTPDIYDPNSMYYADHPSNGGLGLLIATDATPEMGDTLLALERWAYSVPGARPVVIDNGVGAQFGRFSLKLRAEKPNPKFNSKQPEGPDNRRYLEIDTPELRHRGLADQFYKEFSYWIRNARTVKFKVEMELIDLLNLDKTRKVTIGDVTGFIKKMQYTISVQDGLGPVTIEMLYL